MIIDRFMRYVSPEPNTGCWLWTGGSVGGGYGQFWLNDNKPSARAHKVAYDMFVGPVPDGLELDHTCRVRMCVNPSHLEPVTRSENARRGIGPRLAGRRQGSKTHCKSGHPYDEANTYVSPNGARHCRACHVIAQRKQNAKRRAVPF